MKALFIHIPKTAGSSIGKLSNKITYCGHRIYRNNSSDFSFSFVRNPYDRLVSAFFYLKSGGINNYDKRDSNKYIEDSNFEDFIINKLEAAFNNQQHFKPQNYWIPNGVSFIGRFENINEDLNKLCVELGIEYSGKLSVTNTSKHRIFKEYYTDKLADIVYNLYKKDFEIFDYKKDSYK